MDKTTQDIRMAQWMSIINQCQRSGMTVKAWCMDNSVNEKSYFYWQRKIRKQTIQNLQPTTPAALQLVEVPFRNITPSTQAADITLRVGNCTLEIQNTASASLVESLIKVLSHA